MCLPMADAFHAKYEPLGSIWKSCGPLWSKPASSTETPKGRTPPRCVNSCITAAISRTSIATGITSRYTL